MNLKPRRRAADGGRYAGPARVVLGALAGLVAGLGAAPSGASAAGIPQDAYPSPQAIAAHAEFLSQLPAPPGGAGAVCVIDTGVTPLPDTASQIVERIAIDGGSGDDVYHDPADPTSGHGSFVAGTIASQVDGVGSAGIWPAAKIVSVRVFSQRGRGATAADYAAGIQACQSLQRPHNIKAINISLGTQQADPEALTRLRNRIASARQAGMNVVASSGNAGLNAPDYPARIADVVGVSAVSQSAVRCAFSNYGADVDLAALGCDLSSTTFDGSTTTIAGTSYSAPTVAAALVALRSYSPALMPELAEQILTTAASRTPFASILNVAAAFRAAGLGQLVDRYVPPVTPSSPVSAPFTRSEPSRAARRPARPRVLSQSFRNRVETIRLAPLPTDSVAVFSLQGRELRSHSGRVRLRTSKWVSVRVRIEDEWGQRSPTVVVRPARRRP